MSCDFAWCVTPLPNYWNIIKCLFRPFLPLKSCPKDIKCTIYNACSCILDKLTHQDKPNLKFEMRELVQRTKNAFYYCFSQILGRKIPPPKKKKNPHFWVLKLNFNLILMFAELSPTSNHNIYYSKSVVLDWVIE